MNLVGLMFKFRRERSSIYTLTIKNIYAEFINAITGKARQLCKRRLFSCVDEIVISYLKLLWDQLKSLLTTFCHTI